MQEQTIKQQVTIPAGNSSKVSVPVPKDNTASLKGYGYTWYTGNTYQLRTGNVIFPTRTDQEGSASIPRIFDNPFPIRSGGEVSLTITNGDTAEHTYDVVFYILSAELLQVNSTGGELVIATGASTGSAGSVVIYNAALTTAANVTANGLQVETNAPAAVQAGTKAAGAAAAALASSTALKKGVLVQNPSTNTANVLIGNSSAQPVVLEPGDSMFIECNNLALVYVVRATIDQTVNYIGS